MKKQCLLISPPGELNVFPRGIMEIATFLRAKGFSASVLPLGYYMDTHYQLDESGYITQDLDKKELLNILQDAISETDPTVIGISNSYSKDFKNCIDIVKFCKQIAPRALTVMGGHHATFCDKESLENQALDLVVRGEGEGPLLDLLQAATAKKDICQTPGIAFRKNGSIQRNPPRSPLAVDKMPPVDFKILPHNYVRRTRIHGILTRGCAYNCKYCAEKKFWGGPRPYRLEKLIEEMAVLQRDYNTQMVGLEESMLDLRSRKFFDFCQNLSNSGIRLPEQFYVTTRIDAVSDEGVDRLDKAGIKIVCVGIENFSEHVLKMMNKKQSGESILNGCRKLKDKNIWVNSYWLIGHPGDNAREAEYTFSKFKEFFARGLLKSGHAFVFVPYPGTDYFNNPRKYGIKILSYEWQNWRRWTTKPVSCLDDFSITQITAAYTKAKQLLNDYRNLNVYIYKNQKRDDWLEYLNTLFS